MKRTFGVPEEFGGPAHTLPALWPDGVPPRVLPNPSPYWKINGHPVELPEDEGESDESGFEERPGDKL